MNDPTNPSTVGFSNPSSAEKSTPLQRALHSEEKSRPTALTAFIAARRHFLAGNRVEMQQLAEELHVNRVTLYRWVGSREQLITEVIWDVTSKSFATYVADCAEGPRTATVLSRFVSDVNAHPGMQKLLSDEASFALNLLAGSSGEFQRRYISLVRDLIETDRGAGLMSNEIPSDDLAYTAVRITEAYIYTRIITGENPDASRAAVVLRALLR